MTGVICFLLGLFVGAVIGMALPAQDDATEERTQISVIEIWCECFRSPITRITRRRISDYGLQRVFARR